MTRQDFIESVDTLDPETVHDAIQAAVRAVLPGRQQAKNLEPVMVVARTAALRVLRKSFS
jgi:hypothetical protein